MFVDLWLMQSIKANILENGVYMKLSVVGDSLYFGLFGFKLFDIQFGKSTLYGKNEIKESVKLIEMLNDIVATL